MSSVKGIAVRLGFGLGVALCSGLVLAQANAANPAAAPSTTKEETGMTKPTDAQIEKIVTTSNDVEIQMSKLAKDRAQNKDVKKLADHMVKDHEKWNKEAGKLAKKTKTPPEDSDDSRSIAAEGQRIVDRLTPLKGNDFDKAYLEEGAKVHKSVLTAIDEKLLPNAMNSDLKKMLEKTRPKVEEHYAHVQKVQGEMKE